MEELKESRITFMVDKELKKRLLKVIVEEETTIKEFATEALKDKLVNEEEE